MSRFVLPRPTGEAGPLQRAGFEANGDTNPTALRLLFVKERLNWPRAAGGDVHGAEMMRALAARGHAVTLATFAPSPRPAVEGLGLAGEVDLRDVPPADPGSLPPATRLQRKFESYWPQDPAWRHRLAALTRRRPFDAVVALGPDAPLLLRAVRGPLRVWYAADDSALHHWSRLRATDRRSWVHLRHAAVHALYERAFAPAVDRVWAVSPADRAALRLFAGRPADLVPNGVDADHFRPPTPGTPELPNRAAFWGRLDFGPNEEAVAWFLARVWPEVLRRLPDAGFDVFGFQPSPRVVTLCRSAGGVTLTPDLPDLRTELGRRAVAVLPFVSGRGIKNKLLEAAAMGRAVACTPLALTGARGRPPVRCEGDPARLAEAVVDLLGDADQRRRLGAAAREWVTTEHSWAAAAAAAEAGLTAARA